ncbi:hypothetical protein [Tsukamurella strandjordii]|uniref:hypothetical protein n=1 Tax=Tsukamurella strandjordii TaxID=147577 RepID=UPI0031DCC20B
MAAESGRDGEERRQRAGFVNPADRGRGGDASRGGEKPRSTGNRPTGDRSSVDRNGGFRGRDDNRGGPRGSDNRRDGDRRSGPRRDDNRSGGFRGRDDNRSGGGNSGGGYKGRDDNRSGGGYKGRDDNRSGGGFKGRDDNRSGGFRGRDDRRDGGRRGDGPGGDRRDFRSGDNRGGPNSRNGSRPQSSSNRGGPFKPRDDRRTDTRPRTKPGEPSIPNDVDPKELDGAIRRDLLSLDKNNAEIVSGHLVQAGRLLESDPAAALAHARAARERAGRIAAVREACGIAAYMNGEWSEALSELRAAKRMGGAINLLPMIADSERGLGRPEKAIETARGEEAAKLTGDDRTELRIVEAGARMDIGDYDKAVVTLQAEDLDPARRGFHAARLFYAYAEALLAADRRADALTWFLNAAAADEEEFTDAEDRVAELSDEL